MCGKSGTTQQQITIPPEVLARYNSVNATAEQAASKPFQIYSTDPNDFVAPVNATQQAGISGINDSQGMYKPYGDTANSMLNAYQNRTDPLYKQAEGLIPAAYQQGQQYLSGATALAGGAYAGGQGYNQGATGYALAGGQAVDPTQINGAAINQFMNPYLSTVLAGTLAPLQQQQKIDQSNLTGNAIAQGAFGGDRSGIAKAVLAGQQDMATGNVASNILNTGYNNALGAAQQQQGVYLGAGQANRSALQSTSDRLAGIGNQSFQQGNTTANTMTALGQQGYNQGIGTAQAASGLASQIFNQGNAAANTTANLGTTAQQNELAARNAQIQAGTVQQTTDQAGKTALFNQFQQQQAYPFQTAQFLANVAEGTGALSGNTTTTNQPMSFFSDERLKDDMEVIGKTFDGQKIVKFRYKGSPHKHIGLVAQDVEKHHPEAVGLARGFKTVDYDEATKEAADKGHYARGGLVPMAYKRYADGGMAMMYPYGSDAPGRTGGGPYGTGLSPSNQRELMRPGPIPKGLSSGLHDLASGTSDVGSLIDTGTKVYDFAKKHGNSADGDNGDDIPVYARGGLAAGGLPYTANDNEGYVPDNQDNKTAGLQGADSAPGQQESGLHKAASTVKDIAGLVKTGAQIAAMFNRGGLAGGRHGYATDGSVDDDQASRESEMMDEIAAEPPPGLGGTEFIPARTPPKAAVYPPDNMPSEEKYVPDEQSSAPEKKDGNWFDRNRNWLIPVLKGVGTAASSPSRYALGAVLQGVGAGAGAYGDIEKQQAEIARTKMGTEHEKQNVVGKIVDNARNSMYTTPFGNFVFVSNGTPISMGDYMKLVESGKPPSLLGSPPADAEMRVNALIRGLNGGQQAQAAPQQSATAQAPAATTPNVPEMRQQSLPSGVVYDDESRAAADAERKLAYNGGMGFDNAKKTSETYRSNVFGESQAARQNSQYLKELAGTLSNAYSKDGIETPGSGDQFRSDLIRIANTISRGLGGEQIGDFDKSQDVVNKISTLLGQQGAQSGNQESYAALDLIRRAIPNLHMNPEAGAELVSALMTMNRRAIDREEHMGAYGQDSNGLMAHAADDFSRKNSDANYKRDQDILKWLILNDPDGFKKAMSGGVSSGDIAKASRQFFPNSPKSANAFVRYFSPRD